MKEEKEGENREQKTIKEEKNRERTTAKKYGIDIRGREKREKEA